MTVTQVRYVLSGMEGREVPYSTVSSALNNLERWGLVEAFRAPNVRRNASRKSYRAIRKEIAQ
jgi:predicted transcriptional regulator